MTKIGGIQRKDHVSNQLPLAYGIGAGADMLEPLAITVIGSLMISVMLSLVVTPVLYSLMHKIR